MNIKTLVILVMIFCGLVGTATAEQQASIVKGVNCSWYMKADHPRWIKLLTFGALADYEDNGAFELKIKSGVLAFTDLFKRNPDLLKYMDAVQVRFGNELLYLYMDCSDDTQSQSIWYVRGHGHTIDVVEVMDWLEER